MSGMNSMAFRSPLPNFSKPAIDVQRVFRGANFAVRHNVIAGEQAGTMAQHSRIARFLLILARQMIAGGILLIWFTWVQLVMLPDEWLRTIWYLAGAGLIIAGISINRF